MSPAELNEKLEALAKVLKEQNLTIDGCGCCGSPRISVGDTIIAEASDFRHCEISPKTLADYIGANQE